MIPLDDLLGAALGDLDAAKTELVEEHVLGCATCARTYEQILALGRQAAALIGTGHFTMVAPTTVLEELRRQGLITRTYRIVANGEVSCTVSADDIFVAAEYFAELASVTRVDLLTPTTRFENVPFDRQLGRVALVVAGDELRRFPSGTLRYRLVAVEADAERTLGEYAMHHTAMNA